MADKRIIEYTEAASAGADYFLITDSASDGVKKIKPANIVPAFTGDVTKDAGGTVTTIAVNAVTNSKAAQMAAGTIKSNLTGALANASDSTIAAVMDAAFGATQGAVAYRGASGWSSLPPGTSGQFFQTSGPAANPIWQTIPGGGNMLSSTYDPTGKAADAFNYLPARTQAVSRSIISKLNEVISVRDYDAPDDGATDAQPAIQKAINDLAASGSGAQGGTIFFPKPAVAYRLNSPLAVPPFISLRGDAGFSALLANDCDAIQLNGVCGLGCTIIEKLTIRTQNASAKRFGIVQPGNADSTLAQLYDITIRDNLFDGCDAPISLLTGQNITIENNRGQNVGSGIQINGRTYVVCIARNRFAKVAGSGFGSGIGLQIQESNYTDLGTVHPEGVQIERNQFFGFDVGISAAQGYIVNINSNDIDAAVNGIEFTSIDGLNIRDNIVIVRGSGATAGIVGHGRAAAPFGATLIDGNTISGASLVGTSTYGVVINDSGSNQDNVTISHNAIIDVSNNDILVQNPGNIKIRNNKMIQSGAVSSPIATGTFIGARTSGVNVVEGNNSARPIVYNAGDIRAGYVRRRDNVVNGTPENDTLTYVIANGSSAVIAPGPDYYRISARETAVDGSPVSVVASVGQIVSEGLYGEWVTHTTTPAAGKFSIAHDGTDWRIYNNQGATCTFVVNLERKFN